MSVSLDTITISSGVLTKADNLIRPLRFPFQIAQRLGIIAGDGGQGFAVLQLGAAAAGFQLLCRGVVRRQCADDLPNRLAVGGDFDGNRYQTRILLKPGFKLLMGPGMTLPLLRFSPQ